MWICVGGGEQRYGAYRHKRLGFTQEKPTYSRERRHGEIVRRHRGEVDACDGAEFFYLDRSLWGEGRNTDVQGYDQGTTLEGAPKGTLRQRSAERRSPCSFSSTVCPVWLSRPV